MQQPSTDDKGVHWFLRLVTDQVSLLKFLDHDRSYLIAEMTTVSFNQVSWPDQDADATDLFVFMLKSQQESDKYYKQYPNADVSKDDLWHIRDNRGVNSQGKLREYAEKHVSVNQKRRVIEAVLGIHGLAKALFPVIKQLKQLKYDQIEPFCTLLSNTALGLSESYAAVRLHLVDRRAKSQ
ncbi:hypothetical protein UA08_06756 [Talaromyces atroroseus]|uniref:Uncharacterized protein n=1 Tax=Talaromyces atroroseus TaxID=1441469 RepID=A0A225AM12_TALAT|nr:hypothetical protein UA08_06756 [Talaromyces atroroseus]OKL58278.1 hypothetical protein UA08_06756 [Talaromyces atroroseus]